MQQFNDKDVKSIKFNGDAVKVVTFNGEVIFGDTYHSVNLNSQWRQSAIENPDPTKYLILESFSNHRRNSLIATMYITILGYSSFSFYIRSYGELNCDYVIVNKLNNVSLYKSIWPGETLDSSKVFTSTKTTPSSNTSLTGYLKVTFSNISTKNHTICIRYGKDSSISEGDDRGYVLVPLECLKEIIP